MRLARARSSRSGGTSPGLLGHAEVLGVQVEDALPERAERRDGGGAAVRGQGALRDQRLQVAERVAPRQSRQNVLSRLHAASP
ncbi:hypothetical protein LUX57_15980 [Actinomadura madurae]|uniref:hypothetical protein n=1 Tax=Actinomadura madurae TaxID=1993 RepID=UPI0020D22FDA|nr:hypothetical protein [Actinomadura madurae]MCP9966412.1 hypothetical protein [Actinomadura madurae]